jgi:NitT/TauT family transport system substrate-binding protein
MRAISRFVAGLVLACTAALPVRADVTELRITRQPSIVYLPIVIMEHERLLENQAAQAGLGGLKVSWITFSSGGASTEALLSGNVDLVTSGVSNLLLLWDRTRGDVKGVAAASAVPMVLVTRDPDVKGLADFSDKDRIAVPTIKISMQAVVLQMAAEQAFGEAGRNKLDPITVQLGHPDAVGAVLSTNNEVNSHFSLPPYQQLELKDPKVHVVVSSADVVKGPMTITVVYGMRRFHDANPKLMAAFLAALDAASKLIETDPRRAAEIYLDSTKEKLSVDELAAILKEPGVFFGATPNNTMRMAEHLAKAGVIKTKPSSWKDYFFADIHNLPGS